MKIYILGNKYSDNYYDIYETERAKKPVDLSHIDKEKANQIRCIAFVNYLMDFNEMHGRFYRKSDPMMERTIVEIFDDSSPIDKTDILTYLGIDPSDDYEWSAIGHLASDVCEDPKCEDHIKNAIKLRSLLKNDENENVMSI